MDMGDRGAKGDFSPPDDFDGAPPDFDGAMPQRPDGAGDAADGATGATDETMPQPSDTDGGSADGATGATTDGRGGPPEGGGFAMGGQDGATLDYTDDDLDSYSAIWDGAVGDTGDKDHRRVVTALKTIAEGTDLETYLDVDDVLRYLAVHIFSVNDDSLSASMAHNYYLYESGGRLTILPWDYNLAFGGMGGGDATSVVNSAIDDAFTITSFFDTLLEQEGDRYHAYLRQLVTEYVQGGGFDAFYTRTRSQLDALVQDDPTALYSYVEYTAAADALYDLVQLRPTGTGPSGRIVRHGHLGHEPSKPDPLRGQRGSPPDTAHGPIGASDGAVSYPVFAAMGQESRHCWLAVWSATMWG